MREYVSNIIKEETIKTWEKGSSVIIEAPCGSGKSYFIKNSLYEIANEQNKKILMLVPRDIIKNQFIQELSLDKKLDVITVDSYQHYNQILEINNYEKNDLDEYDYIVADESHSFFTDARFNKTTNNTLEYLTQPNHKACVIFISATNRSLVTYIKSYGIYDKERHYIINKEEFKHNLHFFNKMDDISGIIDETEKKHLVFVNSTEKALEFSALYEDSSFVCSKNNKNFKLVNKENYNSIIQNEKMTTNKTFTTTCLDAGVNIHDTIKTVIISNINDIDTIIQCLGRARDGLLNIFIQRPNNKSLNGLKSKTLKEVNAVKHLELYEADENYRSIFGRYMPRSAYLENDRVIINKAMFCKFIVDLEDINSFINFTFEKTISKMLGTDCYENWNDTQQQTVLNKFITQYINQPLTDSQKERLVSLVGIYDKKGRIKKSKGIINAELIEKHGIKIKIKKITVNNKRKNVWVLTK